MGDARGDGVEEKKQNYVSCKKYAVFANQSNPNSIPRNIKSIKMRGIIASKTKKYIDSVLPWEYRSYY